MAALCFSRLRRKGRAATASGAFSIVGVILVAAGLLGSCTDANSANFAGFHGESDGWVGTCPAEFVVGTPTAGMIDATLTVMCDHRPMAAETMAGPFVPETGHYQAVVSGLKTAQNFTYDQDKKFDLTLTPDGCSMAGTVTDADGSSSVSFDSGAQDCP